MINQELLNFIKKSKAVGQTDEQIKSALISAGWPQATIEESFQQLVQLVPPPPPMQSPPMQNYQNIPYPGIDQSLNRMENHWSVKDREKMFISDLGQRIKPGTQPAS